MELESLDKLDAGQGGELCESTVRKMQSELLRLASHGAGCETVRVLSTHMHAHTHIFVQCVRNWSAGCQDVSLRDE